MAKTKDDIKEELDVLGIEYGKDATKAELEDLLIEDIADTVVEEEPKPVKAAETMTAACLVNVRTSPDAKANNIDHRINAGDTIVVVSKKGKWSETDDGLYVMTEYLR